ncbi:MAG TPA: ABC transporter substrate-binding protein [Alphaproteobacteria bacterium]|nr:ABC transporter substrate-binding protein [Alphaproteobacteria bacterium]
MTPGLRALLAAGLALLGTGAVGDHLEAKVYAFPAAGAATREVTIYSTTDIWVARPLITDFQAGHAGINVLYDELQTLELHDRVLEESAAGHGTADLVISSAMDLQMKLANDGYAATLSLPSAGPLPAWTKWRDEAFAISFEPAAIVYNREYFAGRAPPRSRQELTALLDAPGSPLFDRVVTYDIERSGLGFLFLARDAAHSNGIWTLVRLLGANRVKLYTNTAAMLDRIADGRSVLGYNLLGSYAVARAASEPALGVILPEDYTVVTSRIALVPEAARDPEAGRMFLDYLLSARGQAVLADKAKIGAVHPAVLGPNTAASMLAEPGHRLRPIKVGPGLLVYLDQVKRERLLTHWRRALGGH